MKRKYWWVIAAAIAVVVGINMCEGDPSHRAEDGSAPVHRSENSTGIP